MSAQYNEAKVDGDLSKLAPKFRDAVLAAIRECNDKGLDAKVFEAFRSNELQELYYARGRTVIPPNGIVTNAKTNDHSWHGFGLAVDVISKSREWGKPESWFKQVADVFKTHGCKWGGDWRHPDLPHMQWGLCKPSPSSAARELLQVGSRETVWRTLNAL